MSIRGARHTVKDEMELSKERGRYDRLGRVAGFSFLLLPKPLAWQRWKEHVAEFESKSSIEVAKAK